MMSAVQYDAEKSMTADLRCIIHPAEKKTKFWSLICTPGLRYLELVKKTYCVTHAVLDPSSSKEEDLGKSVSVMIKYHDEDRIIAILRHGMTDHVPLGLFFDQEDVTFYIKGNGVVQLLGYEIIWKERKKEICENGISPEKDDKDPSITMDSTLATKNEVLDVSKRSKRASSSSDVHMPSTSQAKSANLPEISKSSFSKKDRVSSGKRASSPKSHRTSLCSLKETLEEMDDVTKLKLSLLGDKDLDEESSEDDEDFDINDVSEDSSSDDNVEGNHSDEDVDKEEESGDDMDEEIVDVDDEEVDDVVDVEDSDEDDVDESDIIQDSEDDDSVDDEYFVKKSKKQENKESEDQKSHQSQVPLKRKKNANIDVMPKKRSKLENSSKVSMDSTSHKPDAHSSDKNYLKENSVPKENQQISKKKKKEQNKIPIAAKEDKPGFKDVQGVQIKDIRPGFGPVAIKGKLVSVFYVGKFVDKNLFDSVLPNNKPLSFRLGSGKMIKGFEIGLEGMKVGGKRKIIVPPNLGYGKKGFTTVPPNSTLYYTIDLTNVS